MSKEIRYVGGSMDGKAKRVRSVGEQKSTEMFIWREFDNKTKKATGRSRRESYRLDRDNCEYKLVQPTNAVG